MVSKKFINVIEKCNDLSGKEKDSVMFTAVMAGMATVELCRHMDRLVDALNSIKAGGEEHSEQLCKRLDRLIDALPVGLE